MEQFEQINELKQTEKEAKSNTTNRDKWQSVQL